MTNSEKANESIASLRSMYDAGKSKVSVGLLGTGLFQTDMEKQVAANYETLGKQIDQLVNQFRPWAEAGHRDGSIYTWDRWFDQAKVLADAVTAQTGYAHDANLFTGVIAPTVTATVEDTAQIVADTGGFLLKYRKPLIVAGALVGSGVLAVYVRSFLPRAK